MSDEFPDKVHKNECGIYNLQDSDEPGSHWCAYYKKGDERYAYDSFGLEPCDELLAYLKTPLELKNKEAVVTCSTFQIQ